MFAGLFLILETAQRIYDWKRARKGQEGISIPLRTLSGTPLTTHEGSGLFYMEDPHLGYRPGPNCSNSIVETNSLGFRGAEFSPEKPKVIATGGIAELIAPYAPSITSVDTLLTLKGLFLLYERDS